VSVPAPSPPLSASEQPGNAQRDRMQSAPAARIPLVLSRRMIPSMFLKILVSDGAGYSPKAA
jgi:hypothetical protein